MRESVLVGGFYEFTTRSATSEADKLDEHLSTILQARFDESPKPIPTTTADADDEEDIPF